MATKTLEKRVSDLEEMVEDVPRLINMRFAHMRAQLDALDARVATLEVKMDNMRAELQALPRVLAEMLDERAKRGGN
jgi:chaperonin cofactor prefoldin